MARKRRANSKRTRARARKKRKESPYTVYSVILAVVVVLMILGAFASGNTTMHFSYADMYDASIIVVFFIAIAVWIKIAPALEKAKIW